MKLGAIIIGQLLAADLSLSTSAAPAIAITVEAPIVQHVAAPLSGHAPPAEVCNENDPNQLSDWRNRPDNPCRPCVKADESTTSTYAISEVTPYCQ
jgi:hypothetical protein